MLFCFANRNKLLIKQGWNFCYGIGNYCDIWRRLNWMQGCDENISFFLLRIQFNQTDFFFNNLSFPIRDSFVWCSFVSFNSSWNIGPQQVNMNVCTRFVLCWNSDCTQTRNRGLFQKPFGHGCECDHPDRRIHAITILYINIFDNSDVENPTIFYIFF